MASAIVTESTLAFLGVSANKTSWGTMLRGSYDWGAATRARGGTSSSRVCASSIGRDGVHAVRPGAGDRAQPAAADEGGVDELCSSWTTCRVTYRIAAGDVPAVRGVSLALAAGEALGMAGESGSGKSTLAMALLRLLPRSTRGSTGEILLDGEDVLA